MMDAIYMWILGLPAGDSLVKDNTDGKIIEVNRIDYDNNRVFDINGNTYGFDEISPIKIDDDLLDKILDVIKDTDTINDIVDYFCGTEKKYVHETQIGKPCLKEIIKRL